MVFHFPRRALLAGIGSLAASRALGQTLGKIPASGEVDVAIIGAGAAGIAAARRVATAGRSYALLEAANRIGGRVWSTGGAFGIEHDRGAHFMSASGRNPLVAIGRLEKVEMKNASPFRRLYVGNREARDNEYDAFTAALRRAGRAITAAGEAGLDVASTQSLPDVGEWSATATFVLGPYALSKDLSAVSAVDFSRREEQPEEIVSGAGLGPVLAAAARNLTVILETPVTRIGTPGFGTFRVETARGAVRADSVIVTAPTSVIASGGIKFETALPKRTLDAVQALSLGTRDRLVFELKGNPFRFADDQKILFKSANVRTVSMTGRAGGTDLCLADFSGRFGREISAKGEAAMAAFVGDLFAENFGAEAKKSIGRAEAVRWSVNPFILGGTSAAAPGGGNARKVLTEPVADRIYFAGEAVHETWFGTVAGAWVSGERAAEAALRGVNARRPRRQ